MDIKELKKAIEAILFISGDAVDIGQLSRALSVPEKEVRQAAACLREDMEKDERAVELIELSGSLQMRTKKETYEYILKMVSVPKENRLTEIQLETLSIIAYKQPVTKLEIENIRGVNSDYAVNRLVEYGLVEEAGRLAAPGRPCLFVTTTEFLRRFGLESLSDLPKTDPEKEAAFKQEADLEAARISDKPKEQ